MLAGIAHGCKIMQCLPALKPCVCACDALACLTVLKPCAFACDVLSLQEQRIRASHNIKQLSNKVADRITMGLKRGRNGRGGTVEAAAAAAAAEGDNSGSSSGGEGQDGAGASRTELADMIRKNGEEIATSVEMVVEKVSWQGNLQQYLDLI